MTRERDTAIARALRWLEVGGSNGERWIIEGCGIYQLPEWSTDDSAAVELLGEAVKRGWEASVCGYPEDGDGPAVYVACICDKYFEEAATFAGAVSGAFLKAMDG